LPKELPGNLLLLAPLGTFIGSSLRIASHIAALGKVMKPYMISVLTVSSSFVPPGLELSSDLTRLFARGGSLDESSTLVAPTTMKSLLHSDVTGSNGKIVENILTNQKDEKYTQC
jgi:hypothetical protein